MAPTLIEFAKGNYNISNVRSLINRQSMNSRDTENRTPLHLATIYGKPDLMRLLLDAGADIEALDQCQETPLHLAACYRVQTDIVQLLVTRGAKLDAIDYEGRTPLIWAARKGFGEIIGILTEAGASRDINDNHGKTAADQAHPDVKYLVLHLPPTNPPNRPTYTRPHTDATPCDDTRPLTDQNREPIPRPATPPTDAGRAPVDIYAFIEGRHIKQTKLPVDFINDKLRQEPFGRYLADKSESKRPLTLKKLLNILGEREWLAYAVDEGIGLTFKTPRENSRVRIVVICTPGYKHGNSKMADGESLKSKAFTVPTMAILAVPPSDDPDDINSDRSILQVASFNPKFGWFNFYDRARGQGGQQRWCYFGSSIDAYTPDTQGLGPFCGHANGTIVMREPEAPWLHWHRKGSELSVPAKHSLYNDPLHRDQDTGKWYFGEPEQLAAMIDRGTKAWFERRHILDFGEPAKLKDVAERVHQWIAHVCLTTSIAVSSSIDGKGKDFRIPSGFFFNARALELVVPGMINLEKTIKKVQYNKYQEARDALDLVTVFKFTEPSEEATDKKTEDKVAMNSEGQTWKVVTPSLEDIDGIRHIQDARLLPDNVLTAMLMVDFWNPVFSYRRAQLMRYIPSTATRGPKPSSKDLYTLGVDLKNVVANQVVNLKLSDTSPEVEFSNLMLKKDLASYAKEEVKRYIEQINKNLDSCTGVLGYMKLAETKRRLFRPAPKTQRPQNPLGEFAMMLPYARKMDDKETWLMTRDATVVEQEPPKRIWHPRNSQVHYSSAGCPFSASF